MFKVPTSKYLETLSENSEIFYKKVEEVDGLQFSIYNYRLASYLDFVDKQCASPS
jgi:hypothetical protein